jgi:glycosyltransferase involved in cell wall biosynthesis
LLRSPSRRKNLAGAGRAQALAKHDWDRIADRYERLYEGAVGQHA